MQIAEQSEEKPEEKAEEKPWKEEEIHTTSEREEKQDAIQMQSICGVCPFKHRASDYGKRILHSYPSMKPFSDIQEGGCVRMELQDIGCLPIKFLLSSFDILTA